LKNQESEFVLRLYLVRHGETVWNFENRIQGASDVPLNDRGREQAESLAIKLQKIQFFKILSSPLERAFETAKIISLTQESAISKVDCFAELDQGKLEGLKFKEIQEKFPDFSSKWRIVPGEVRMPGGETLNELQERAWQGIQNIYDEFSNEEEPILIVSHNLAIICILSKILDVSLNEFRKFRQHNASVNIIEHDSMRGWSVVTMNDLSHLS
tara:strand:+ start:16291 stop:16929 length:639 start_codon:yes stop_codon:yes gene_type:complete